MKLRILTILSIAASIFPRESFPADEKSPPEGNPAPAAKEAVGKKDEKAAPAKSPSTKASKAAKKEKAAPTTPDEILFQKAEDAFQLGEDCLQGRAPFADAEKHFREAIQIFDEVIQKFPLSEKAGQSAYTTGTCWLLMDDPEKALKQYEKVWNDYPAFKDRVYALYRQGVCYASLDRAADARFAFTRITREAGIPDADVKKAQKALREMEVVGRPSMPLRTSEWVNGVAAEGLKTFHGEVVCLIFFATWCPNCQKEWPHFKEILRRMGLKGVIFLGVCNPEDPMSTEAVEPYLKRNSLEFMDVALDHKDASQLPYRVHGFPACCLIDRKGIIRWRGHPTFLSMKMMEKLLAEK